MRIKYLQVDPKKEYKEFRHMSDAAKKEYARIICMYFTEESTLLGIANKLNMQFATSEHGYLNEITALVVGASIYIYYRKLPFRVLMQCFDLIIETLVEGNLKEMVVFQNNDTKRYFSKCVWDKEYDKASSGSKIVCIVGEYNLLNDSIAGNIQDQLNRQHDEKDAEKSNISIDQTR